MLSGAAGTFHGLVGENARNMGAPGAATGATIPTAVAASSAASATKRGRMCARESIALPVDRPLRRGLERLRRRLRGYWALFEKSGERGFSDLARARLRLAAPTEPSSVSMRAETSQSLQSRLSRSSA